MGCKSIGSPGPREQQKHLIERGTRRAGRTLGPLARERGILVLTCGFAPSPSEPSVPHLQDCGGSGVVDRLLLPTGKEAGDDADDNSHLDDDCALAGAGRGVPAKPVELATATNRVRLSGLHPSARTSCPRRRSRAGTSRSSKISPSVCPCRPYRARTRTELYRPPRCLLRANRARSAGNCWSFGCERLGGQCGHRPPVVRRSCLAAFRPARNHRDRADAARAAFRFLRRR